MLLCRRGSFYSVQCTYLDIVTQGILNGTMVGPSCAADAACCLPVLYRCCGCPGQDQIMHLQCEAAYLQVFSIYYLNGSDGSIPYMVRAHMSSPPHLLPLRQRPTPHWPAVRRPTPWKTN